MSEPSNNSYPAPVESGNETALLPAAGQASPEPDQPRTDALDVKQKPDSVGPRGGRLKNINRFAIIGLLVAVTAAMYPIIKLFFVPVIVAATFVTLFYPLYLRINKLFHDNRGLSSFVCCLLIFLCLVTPTYMMVNLVVRQGMDVYQTAGPVIKDIVEKGNASEFLTRIKNFPVIQWIQLSPIDLSIPLNEAIKKLVVVGSSAINKTSAGMLELLTNLFVMFFTMFYFFMDGESLVKRLRYLMPLRGNYENMIISRFLLISRATVVGTVIVSLIQGTLGALTLLVFGIKSWLIWGFIMLILSIMPLVGAWTVLIPAGLIQLILGNVWQGIGICATSLIVVSNIDNLIRPRLVGKEAKLHDLVIFFSSLGGIAVFGVMGFIVGPVIAALFVAVLDIYEMEFEQQLGVHGE